MNALSFANLQPFEKHIHYIIVFHLFDGARTISIVLKGRYQLAAVDRTELDGIGHAGLACTGLDLARYLNGLDWAGLDFIDVGSNLIFSVCYKRQNKRV